MNPPEGEIKWENSNFSVLIDWEFIEIRLED